MPRLWFGLILIYILTRPALAVDSPVADAAERGDHAGLRVSIEQHADVNQAQVDGMSALHWAAWQRNLDSLKLLVAAGANAKAVNRYGVTPLALACTGGDPAVVVALLDAGANPNGKLAGDETALMTAARTGIVAPVQALLDHGAEINAREHRGQTALMWAAAEGHADVVDLLIHRGADFRTPLASGFTPLFFAVREGKVDTVRVLLAAGADVNETMEPKKIAGKGPIRGTSPLVLAVENGHFDLARILLVAGADPNDQRSGFTPLHTLTWVRKPNRGDDESGDPTPVGSGSLTSLQLAQELVRHGADVNSQLTRGPSGRGILSRVGATPFLLASQTADIPFMRVLLKLGADPKLPNAQGATPFMAAAGLGTIAPSEEAGTEEEALAAVQLLLKLGADVNMVDANGETAMHGAAYKSFPAMVQWLADHGARPEVWNQKDKYGWTPLNIAEGHRPGNFKPSPETLAALQRILPASTVRVP